MHRMQSRVLVSHLIQFTVSNRIPDPPTPKEINYFTPDTNLSQTLRTVSNRRGQSHPNIFEDFTPEDPFAGAIITSLDDTDILKDVIATGLTCELKIYEVRYNSRGQSLTILIERAHTWSIRNDSISLKQSNLMKLPSKISSWPRNKRKCL